PVSTNNNRPTDETSQAQKGNDGNLVRPREEEVEAEINQEKENNELTHKQEKGKGKQESNKESEEESNDESTNDEKGSSGILAQTVKKKSQYGRRKLCEAALMSIRTKTSRKSHKKTSLEVKVTSKALPKLALFACRTAWHNTTKFDLFYLVYSREATLPVDLIVESYPIIDDLFEARIQACENIRKAQQLQKWHHSQQYLLQSYEIEAKVMHYKAKLGQKLGEN
ncbi:44442_t:CDS:2, partial [Gigaspora margarita]